jgi:hypothetical protein
MTRALGWSAGAIGLVITVPAMAQWYMQSDPCGPPPTLPGYVVLLRPEEAARRAQACQRQRDEVTRRQQAAAAATAKTISDPGPGAGAPSRACGNSDRGRDLLRKFLS